MSKDFKTNYQNYKQRIGQGFLTSSKHPDRFIPGIYPELLVDAGGAYVYDINNKFYIDTISALGSVFLGYAPFKQNVVPGISLGSPLEVELAERLNEVFPWVKNWKFLKTGTEACQAAIRIARAYTGRDLVLSSGYHGWSDEFISLCGPSGKVAGIPEEKKTNIKNLEEPGAWEYILAKKVAAVIVEPVETDNSQDRIDALKKLKNVCHEFGTLLIFDEVITSFRYKEGSVSRLYGIYPDLILLGKALGNGVAISAIGGMEADILNNPKYFVSGTYCGERVGLAAAIETLKKLGASKKVMEKLWTLGGGLQDFFNIQFSFAGLQLVGYPTRLVFVGNEKVKALVWQEACKSGLLLGPSIFLTLAHLDKIDLIKEIFKDVGTKIRHGGLELEGKMPTPAFHKQNNNKTTKITTGEGT